MPFPFVERDKAQARPALIVSNPVGPDGSLLWMVMITSARRGAWPGDVAIGADHASYGLPIPCYIRTAKIAALEITAIERTEGRIPETLMQRARERMMAALGW